MDQRTEMWLRLGSRVPNVMLGNCEAMRRYLIEDEHVPPDRVEMIYNGVDTTQFLSAGIATGEGIDDRHCLRASGREEPAPVAAGIREGTRRASGAQAGDCRQRRGT